MSLNKGFDCRATPEAVALCEQVRALGVNKNQIAHHVNATGQLDDVPELRELYREIKAVFAGSSWDQSLTAMRGWDIID